MRAASTTGGRAAILVLGLVAVIAITALTTEVANSTAVTETALLLAVVVCAISVVWWPAGAVTSLAAGFSLNWTHTEPRHSLRISSASNVIVVALLTLLGPGVAWLVARRERAGRRAALGDVLSSGTTALDEAGQGAVPALGLWHITIDAVGCPLLDVEARLAAIDDPAVADLPVVARPTTIAGSPSGTTGVVLPHAGAVLHFADPRLDKVLVLSPRAGSVPFEIDRDTLFSFRDQVETVVLRAPRT